MTFAAVDFAAEVRQALTNVVAALAAAGARPDQIARLTWYITDRDEYLNARAEIGRAYRDVIGRHFPAMSVVVVQGLIEKQRARRDRSDRGSAALGSRRRSQRPPGCDHRDHKQHTQPTARTGGKDDRRGHDDAEHEGARRPPDERRRRPSTWRDSSATATSQLPTSARNA